MWYALVQDEQLGPMPAHEVQQLFEQKVIVGDTLVWRAGMNDWVALCQLPEFMHLFSEGDKTVAADFDTLFGELDEDERTMLGVGLDDAPDLGAAVDALLDDPDPAPAPDPVAPTDDADEMTIGAPAPPMAPRKPAPPASLGRKPLPPAPLGPKLGAKLGAQPLPPAPAFARAAPPPEEGTMELGDGDLFGDLLEEAAAAVPARAPDAPVDGTMELGDGDLFAGLLEEAGGVEELEEIEELESLDSLDEVAEPFAAPMPPAPPSPFGLPAPPAAPLALGVPDSPTAEAPMGQIDFGAMAGLPAAEPDPAPAASPFGPGPRVTSAAIEPPTGKKKSPLLLVLLLVVIGGGLGAAVLMLTGPDQGDPDPRLDARAVTAPRPVAPDAALSPDAAPPPPDAAVVDAAVVDAAPAVVDAAVDAVIDAAPPPPDAAKVAVRPPPRRTPTPRRPPPPPKNDKPAQLSRDDIQTVVKTSEGQLKACAADVPAVKGKTVSVLVTINRNGRIGRTRVTSASLRGTAAEGCVENQLKTLRFPEFTGDPMTFPLPIKL